VILAISTLRFFLIADRSFCHSLSKFCRKLLLVRKSCTIVVCVSYAQVIFESTLWPLVFSCAAGKLVRGGGLMGLKVIMSLTRHCHRDTTGHHQM